MSSKKLFMFLLKMFIVLPTYSSILSYQVQNKANTTCI